MFAAQTAHSFQPASDWVVLLEHPGRSRQALAASFVARGFQVVATDSVEAALTSTRRQSVRLVVMEALLHDVPTLPLIARIKSEHPEAHVTVCTTFGSIRNVVKTMRAGASSFLIKPVTADQVLLDVGELDQGPQSEQVEHPSYHRAVWEYVTQCRDLAGSVAEASRRLGLERRSLRRMLQKSPPAR
jgi:two-component system response regulator RegA